MLAHEKSCPYIGLQPFTNLQSRYFFGRDDDIQLVSATLYASPITILFGPSGVGKSSLLHAGVAPYLRQSPRTTVVTFGKWDRADFADSLKAACIEAFSAAGCEAKFDPESGLDELILSGGQSLQHTIILLLDQFEEYLLYHSGTSRGDRFESELARAVNRPDFDGAILLSLREDFLSKLDYLQARIPNLLRKTVTIEHLTRDAAENAIRRPLNVYNDSLSDNTLSITIEDALVQALLRQLRVGKVRMAALGGSGSRPESRDDERIEASFLQLVLIRLWKEETEVDSLVLREETLTRLGSGAKIIQNHLNGIFAGLSRTQMEICAKVFPHLVTPSGGKIAQTKEDLVVWSGKPAVRIEPLLRTLSEHRVLCRTELPERYEIFHDVLAPGILDWRARWQARIKLQRAMQVISLVMLAMAVATLFFYERQKRANKDILSNNLAAAAIHNLEFKNPQIGLQLARCAALTTKNPLPDALTALQRAVQAWQTSETLPHSGPVRQVAYNLDGSLLATASFNNTARIWKTLGGDSYVTLSGHTGPLRDIAFSSTGLLIATASEDGTVRLWNTNTGAPIAKLSGHSGTVSGVAFSPDGKLLATASQDETVRIWDLNTRTTIWSIARGTPVHRVAFAPNSNILAIAGSNPSPALFNIETKSELLSLNGHDADVYDIRFNFDGTLIATASADATARIWDATSGKQLLKISGHGSTVSAVAFSHDGTRLATASFDRSARVWDVVSGKELFTLRGHADTVTSVVFHPSDNSIATSSFDKTVRIWSQPGVLFHSRPVFSVAFSLDGQQLIAATQDDGVWVYEMASKKLAKLQRGSRRCCERRHRRD